MHNPPYTRRGIEARGLEYVAYQQERAAGLASIARTFLIDGNLREAVRFQELSATAYENARNGI